MKTRSTLLLLCISCFAIAQPTVETITTELKKIQDDITTLQASVNKLANPPAVATTTLCGLLTLTEEPIIQLLSKAEDLNGYRDSGDFRIPNEEIKKIKCKCKRRRKYRNNVLTPELYFKSIIIEKIVLEILTEKVKSIAIVYRYNVSGEENEDCYNKRFTYSQDMKEISFDELNTKDGTLQLKEKEYIKLEGLIQYLKLWKEGPSDGFVTLSVDKPTTELLLKTK